MIAIAANPRCAKGTQSRIIPALHGHGSTLPQFAHMARTMKTYGATSGRWTLAGTLSPVLWTTGSKRERA